MLVIICDDMRYVYGNDIESAELSISNFKEYKNKVYKDIAVETKGQKFVHPCEHLTVDGVMAYNCWLDEKWKRVNKIESEAE